MANLDEILQKFDPITLGEMNYVKLLNRVDTKYIFHARYLNKILELLQKDYDVLIVDGKRTSRYDTTYWDTPDYQMYTEHHNGKSNRYKIRFRTYLDSNLKFFEIKFKTNTGRTIKKRVKVDMSCKSITSDAQKLLEKETSYKPSSLIRAMQVDYDRITLVNKNRTERLTIDVALNFSHENSHMEFPNLVIAEVKQERSCESPFISIMKEKRVKDSSLSKYCLGMASIVENIKTNNFKPKVRYVNQLLSSQA